MNRSISVRRLLIVALALVLIVAAAVPAAFAQGGDEGEPRTVNDFMGRPFTIDAPPQRVIGLSKSINQMLFAVGVTPAGVTADMDFPAAAADLPVIGSGYAPSLEAIAALEPDLIVANGQLQMDILPQLEDIAPTLVIMTLTAEDVINNIRLLGQVTWNDTAAEYLALSYESVLAMGAEIGAAKDGPSILIVVGTLDQPNYGKSETYLGSLAALLGATNIADGEADAGPFPGYAQLSVEAILEADPDVILTMTRGPEGIPPMNETMAEDPIWSAMSAVENGRAIELDYRVYLESPGPLFPEALMNLYTVLYGGM